MAIPSRMKKYNSVNRAVAQSTINETDRKANAGAEIRLTPSVTK